MGRKDAVQVILEVVARCKQLLPALRVDYLPGWETRGNGTSANYVGGSVHHTGSYSSLSNPFPTRNILINGRPDLSGPLCNFGGPACTVEAPVLAVVAAFPANHAGASGGRSMGPLPVTSLFNPWVLGLEIDYAGSTPMLAGQDLVAKVWARAVSDVLAGGNIEFVRAHAETSITGKWDPGYAMGKTVDMAAFRASAKQISSTSPAVPAPQESSMSDVRIAVGPERTCWIAAEGKIWWSNDITEVSALAKMWGIPITSMANAEIQKCIDFISRRKADSDAATAAAVSKILPTPSLTPKQIRAMSDEITTQSAPDLSEAVPLTEDDLQQLLEDSEIDTTSLVTARKAA